MVHKPRVYQVLRKAGVITTRKHAQEIIRQERLSVHGRIIHSLDFQFNPAKEILLLDGKPIFSSAMMRYIMLHKPVGYITATKRIHGKKHVMELLDLDLLVKNTLYPVGRLDLNTSGLLIITSDGTFTKKLLSAHVEKEYRVVVEGTLTLDNLRQIERGIIIMVNEKPYKTLPANLMIESKTTATTTLRLILHEGKKRQIRLIMDAVGHPVISLQRIRIGKLLLGSLPVGKWREIHKENVML